MTDIDVSTAKPAIQTIVAYPRLIHDAAIQAQAVPLGPWTVSISCNYGSSDANHYSFSFSIDFAVTRTQLRQALATAESQAATFLDHFNFISVWMGQTMPLTSTVFATAVASVGAAVNANKGGTLTPEMVVSATNDLTNLVTTLQANSQQLTAGMAGLAQFNNQLVSCGQQIQLAAATLTSTAQSAINQATDQVRSAPCGGDGAMSQVNAFQAQLAGSGALLHSAITTLGGQAQDAQNAVSVLVGTVLNLTNAYQGVLNQLKTVQGQAAASMMEQIRLTIAANSWNELTQYATSQIGSERAQLEGQLRQQVQFSQGLKRIQGFQRTQAASETDVLSQITNALTRVYGGVP